jgi:hypothetical protein
VSWSVAVTYATADGSATSAGDYERARGTVRFLPGQQAKTVNVTVNGDTAIESDETLAVGLSRPVNATISDGIGTGTIENDDTPKPRSGSYSGTTSQGRAIRFDVSPDATYVTHLGFAIDIACAEIGEALTDFPVDFGPVEILLSPSWGFSMTDSYEDSDGRVDLVLNGSLTTTGSASGTARVDALLHTDFGDIHCSTGDVTWSAH